MEDVVVQIFDYGMYGYYEGKREWVRWLMVGLVVKRENWRWCDGQMYLNFGMIWRNGGRERERLYVVSLWCGLWMDYGWRYRGKK